MARKAQTQPQTDQVQPPQDSGGPLPLMSLDIANVLRIHAVRLTMPKDGTLVIEGANEQGKSSVVRSLLMLLAGRDADAADPLHGNEEEGHVVATFGDYEVSLELRRGRTPALKIASASGKVKAPQTLLAGFLDYVSLNPLEFSRKPPAEQLATVARVVGFDAAPFDARRKAFYDERTETNRTVDSCRAELRGLVVDPAAPEVEVSSAALVDELKRRQEHNQEGARREREAEQARDRVKEERRKLEAAAARVKELERQMQAAIDAQLAQDAEVKAREEAAKLTRVALAQFEPSDTDEIQTQIAGADAVNRKVRDKVRSAKLSEDLMNAEETVKALTGEIGLVDQQKAEARKAAAEALAIDGLEVSDTELLYRGKPLSQAGKSASLRVSCAVAMALNRDKRVKLLLVDDAEALDGASFRQLVEQAAAGGYQVIVTRVIPDASAASAGAVVIEDGYVRQ